jgi:1,4-dihydroxy-6-naphthoate synthase
MDESVMRKHVDLYVNDYTVALGQQGNLAVQKLIEVFKKINAGSVPAEQTRM